MTERRIATIGDLRCTVTAEHVTLEDLRSTVNMLLTPHAPGTRIILLAALDVVEAERKCVEACGHCALCSLEPETEARGHDLECPLLKFERAMQAMRTLSAIPTPTPPDAAALDPKRSEGE